MDAAVVRYGENKTGCARMAGVSKKPMSATVVLARGGQSETQHLGVFYTFPKVWYLLRAPKLEFQVLPI